MATIKRIIKGQPPGLTEAKRANELIDVANALVDMEVKITTTGRSGVTYAGGRAILSINANDIAAKLP